jgi:hypothetical protein
MFISFQSLTDFELSISLQATESIHSVGGLVESMAVSPWHVRFLGRIGVWSSPSSSAFSPRLRILRANVFHPMVYR